MRRPRWIWGGRVAAVVLLAGLGAYLASVGLGKASMLASVIGLLVAVAALVAPYLLPSSDEGDSGHVSTQQVSNTSVGGQLTQVRNTQSVRVEDSGAPRAPQAPPQGADTSSEGRGGQNVSGVWVGGNLTQVDGANGDITIG